MALGSCRRTPAPFLLALAVAGLLTAAAGPPEPQVTIGATTITNDYPKSIGFEVRVASRSANTAAVELRLRVRGESATLLVPADFVPTRRPIAWVEWNPKRAGVPPGAVLRYSWWARDDAGHTVESDPQQWIVEDARFSWQTLGNDDLGLWWYDGDENFGQRVFATAEAALDGMRRSAQVDVTERLHVVL